MSTVLGVLGFLMGILGFVFSMGSAGPSAALCGVGLTISGAVFFIGAFVMEHIKHMEKTLLEAGEARTKALRALEGQYSERIVSPQK